MKGQFYILAAFIVGMYIFFILRMFTSTTSSFKIPEIPQIDYIHGAAQDALDEEGSIDTVLEAINYIPEPIGVRCVSLATGKGSCELYEDEWACGVNVTVVYRGKANVDVTKRIYTKKFYISSQRTPIYIYPNESSNLVSVSMDVGISSGTLKDTSGKTLKGNWSGNTVTFRTNLVKNRPKVIQVYHAGSTSYTLYSDIGVLNGGSYDASVLYNKLSGKRQTQNLTLSDLDDINNGAGPQILFLPAPYPSSYGTALMNYVDEGGILVSPYGLCTVIGSCLVGNIETTLGGTLEGVGDFTTLNPITTGSDYFTNPDIPWVVYNTTGANTSKAAIGALAYGEGYVVFVGNESMLNTWNQLDAFLNQLLGWGSKPISVTKQTCPVQAS